MVIVLLRHFKQTHDFTSFPRQAIIAHQSKLNSYFRALQYHSLLGADYYTNQYISTAYSRVPILQTGVLRKCR